MYPNPTPVPRRALLQVIAVAAAAFLFLIIGSSSDAFAGGKGKSRVDGYDHAKHRLDVRKGGKVKSKRLARKVRVNLVSKRGKSATRRSKADRASVNQLVRGAVIADTEAKRGKLVEIDLVETPAGSSDCSFDESSDSEDGEREVSWDCSTDYQGESQDCSFDESSESEEGEHSRDTSWDCSYDLSTDSRELGWDCSYDSSQSSSPEDADGDLSFDCSWDSSEALDAPLWECGFASGEAEFTCASKQLGQEFGAALDPADAGFDPFVEFTSDYVANPGLANGSATCDGSGGSVDCSFDGDRTAGNCEVDYSFDRSHEPDFSSGDVSGDLSYSCSKENGGGGSGEESDGAADES